VFFNLPQAEKDALGPTPQSSNRGYFGVGNEKVRGLISMRENFDFGGADFSSIWPEEGRLPGFCDFATGFHKVYADIFLGCSSSLSKAK
jgi:hypothetical protein